MWRASFVLLLGSGKTCFEILGRKNFEQERCSRRRVEEIWAGATYAGGEIELVVLVAQVIWLVFRGDKVAGLRNLINNLEAFLNEYLLLRIVCWRDSRRRLPLEACCYRVR